MSVKRAISTAVALLALAMPAGTQPGEPVVRIGLNPNAATVVVRASVPFTVGQTQTRSAKFTPVATVPAQPGILTREQLQYRMAVEVDGGKLLMLPMATHIRMAAGARME